MTIEAVIIALLFAFGMGFVFGTLLALLLRPVQPYRPPVVTRRIHDKPDLHYRTGNIPPRRERS